MDRYDRLRQIALENPCRADALAWLTAQPGLAEEQRRNFERIISKVIVLTPGDPESIWEFTDYMNGSQPYIYLPHGDEPVRRYMYEVLESIKTGERVELGETEYIISSSGNPRDINPKNFKRVTPHQEKEPPLLFTTTLVFQKRLARILRLAGQQGEKA